MKKLFIYTICCFLFVACNKDDDGFQVKVYTKSGRLFKNCEKEPYAYMTLDFFDFRYGGIGRPSTVEYFTTTMTDETGYFEIKFTGQKGVFKVRNDDGDDVFSGGFSKYFSQEQNPVEYFEYYSRTKLKHPVKILTDKPFTAQDTLLVGTRNVNGFVLELIGPFKNNQVETTKEFGYVLLRDGIAPYKEYNDIVTSFAWGIGQVHFNELSTKGEIDNPQIVYDVPQRLCDGDTVVIDLTKM